MLLRNLTLAAPWTPRFYNLDWNSGVWKPTAAPASDSRVSGYGSTLLTLTDRGWIKRLLAIYLRNGEWKIFDGELEMPLIGDIAKWRSQKIGQASLTLHSSTGDKRIVYFRPWLRHWFEGGWSLDDIDIAHLISRGSMDSDVLPRLQRAIDAANLELRSGV